jgi:hypothetical protein
MFLRRAFTAGSGSFASFTFNMLGSTPCFLQAYQPIDFNIFVA